MWLNGTRSINSYQGYETNIYYPVEALVCTSIAYVIDLSSARPFPRNG